jgi:hypothetical protein
MPANQPGTGILHISSSTTNDLKNQDRAEATTQYMRNEPAEFQYGVENARLQINSVADIDRGGRGQRPPNG